MTQAMATLKEQLQPQHTALLVIDMQNDFCAQGGYMQRERNYDVSFADEVAGNIEVLVGDAREAGAHVVWVHSHYDFKYLSASHKAKRQREGCCLEGSWGAQPYRVLPGADEMVIYKHHYSGFQGTNLDNWLRARDVRTLVLVGVATNVCVDSTLRDGFFLGYHIVLAEDCVGSNSQVGHAGTLATVNNNIGTVTSSRRIAELLAGRVPA